MIEHELKSWPEFFDPIINGPKNFDVRKNDRNFKVGDRVRFQEWEPPAAVIPKGGSSSGQYTGRECWRDVVYVLEGIGPGGIEPLKGLQQGYCVLGLR